AGNFCTNLDDWPQADEDCGAIIVGGTLPGRSGVTDSPAFGQFCRDPPSNFCQSCEPPSLVHISAWFSSITTCGYGDLFVTPKPDGNGLNYARSYTRVFGGTSGATPMVAGLATCLQ